MTRSPLTSWYHPLSEEHLENPYPFFQWAREEDPVFYTDTIIQGKRVYVVTRFDDIMHILKYPALFSSKDALHPLDNWEPETFAELAKGFPVTRIHLDSDGDAHMRFRTPLLNVLHPQNVQIWGHRIRDHANALIDSFIEQQQTDFIAKFAYPLPLEVILMLFHLPIEDRQQVKRWTDDWVALVTSSLDKSRQVECAKSFVRFQHYLAQVIDQRRHAPAEHDLVSAMITSVVPGSLSQNELINALGGILLAGHETATNMIANGLSLLLHPRERWKYLCLHPELIPQWLEEMLRYDSPAQTFFRTTVQETEVGGVRMPEGSLLLILFGSAHRDEMHFAHADQFLPERQERHFVFGYGPHYCVGAALARLEGQIAFEELTKRLPHLRLEKQTLRHVPTLQFRGFESLFVSWSKPELAYDL